MDKRFSQSLRPIYFGAKLQIFLSILTAISLVFKCDLTENGQIDIFFLQMSAQLASSKELTGSLAPPPTEGAATDGAPAGNKTIDELWEIIRYVENSLRFFSTFVVSCVVITTIFATKTSLQISIVRCLCHSSIVPLTWRCKRRLFLNVIDTDNFELTRK